MLRITTTNEESQIVTLRVEGRIVKDSIVTLERECNGLFVQGKSIELDFWSVTFIDTQGVAVVKNLLTGNVRMGQCPALIRSLIDEEGTP